MISRLAHAHAREYTERQAEEAWLRTVVVEGGDGADFVALTIESQFDPRVSVVGSQFRLEVHYSTSRLAEALQAGRLVLCWRPRHEWKCSYQR